MKKITQLTSIAYLLLILLIIGVTNLNNPTNNEIAPAAFAFVLVIWIFAILSALPLLKTKNHSNLLWAFALMQIFLTPINTIVGPSLVVLHKTQKISLKLEGQAGEESKNETNS